MKEMSEYLILTDTGKTGWFYSESFAAAVMQYPNTVYLMFSFPICALHDGHSATDNTFCLKSE
jgi:hypothetical protein